MSECGDRFAPAIKERVLLPMTTPTGEEGAEAKLRPTQPPSERGSASRARKKGSRAPRGALLSFMFSVVIRNCYRFWHLISDCAYNSSAPPPDQPAGRRMQKTPNMYAMLQTQVTNTDFFLFSESQTTFLLALVVGSSAFSLSVLSLDTGHQQPVSALID